MTQHGAAATRAAGFLCIAVLAACSSAFAQSAVAGTWNASADARRPGTIQFQFEPRRLDGRRGEMGVSVELAELAGLSLDQAGSAAPSRFSLVREAGRIDCDGSFQNGRGSGTFQFTPNDSFIAVMKARGFDFARAASNRRQDVNDRMFAATAMNVTTLRADDLLSAGFSALTIDDLFKAAIFNVDSAFAREMQASGFPNMVMEELVKARIFHIDGDFVREAAQMGLPNQRFEDLVKMRIFNIDADFVRRAQADGVPLDVEQLVRERIGVPARRGRRR